MEKRMIPVSAPSLNGNEKKYVIDCLDSTWISSSGSYIERFEQSFADFCGVRHAVSCCNGTVALHLALLALGIGPGDEVIVPTLTFVATANTVVYCGATPVFVDSEAETWNIDAAKIEEKITPRTKAIIVVHLYGHPADMDAIKAIAQRHNLIVVEDAAEAHGATYKGKRAGSLGNLATFSFYGNKIVTTGEGGMVVTDDDALAEKLRQLKGQGQDPNRRYWFPIIGYNYRMTNVAAAIGLAQMERVEWHMEQRRRVVADYHAELKDSTKLFYQPEQEWATHAYWMLTLALQDHISISRDQLMTALAKRGIETRPVFYPMHTLPPYLSSAGSYPVAERIARRGFNVPTWAGVTREDVHFICQSLAECLADTQTTTA